MQGRRKRARSSLLRGIGREETPWQAPAHVPSPRWPHFPVSAALVHFDKAVSTPQGGHASADTEEPSPPWGPGLTAENPEHRHPPCSAGCEPGAAGGLPCPPGSARGRGRQQEVTTASREWKLQASRPSRKGLQVGGGAPGSQVWTPASSSAERRRQGWEIRTGALRVNQGPIWDEEAHQSPQQAQFQTKSRLLNRQEEDPKAAHPLRDGAQEWGSEKSGGACEGPGWGVIS